MEKLLPLMLVTLSLVMKLAQSRELRPTEHGLPYQNLPSKTPEMMLFFGEQQVSSPQSNTPSPITAGIVQQSSTDNAWFKEKKPEKTKESNVRKGLLIATVVCGGTAIVFLLAAAFLFAFHFFKRRSNSSELTVVAHNSAVNGNVTTVNTVVPNK